MTQGCGQEEKSLQKNQRQKENKEYLPNVKIPNSVIATSSLKDAIENTDIILFLFRAFI